MVNKNNPISKAQDILSFEGQVSSAECKEIIRELLVHIALYPTSKVIRDLEEELVSVKEDRDGWKRSCNDLLISLASAGREYCK
jgi:hypothetical protein